MMGSGSEIFYFDSQESMGLVTITKQLQSCSIHISYRIFYLQATPAIFFNISNSRFPLALQSL